MTDAKSLVDVSSKGAEAFIDLFYRTFDTQRHVLNGFYRPHSKIVWNGTPYAGAEVFATFVNTLPPSTHEVMTSDCHPLTTSINSHGTCSILVNVNGTVKYGNDPATQWFSQTFILAPDSSKADQSNFFVLSDCFRLVS